MVVCLTVVGGGAGWPEATVLAGSMLEKKASGPMIPPPAHCGHAAMGSLGLKSQLGCGAALDAGV